MGVTDPLLDSVDVDTCTTLLVVGVTVSVMGVADPLEFAADMMGVANVLELTGDAADMTILLMGVTEMVELDEGVATLVMGVAVVVTTNNDSTLVVVRTVDVATAEVLIGGISLLLQMGGATVTTAAVGGAPVAVV